MYNEMVLSNNQNIMFKLMGKNIFTILHSKFLFYWTYDISLEADSAYRFIFSGSYHIALRKHTTIVSCLNWFMSQLVHVSIGSCLNWFMSQLVH